MIENVKRLLTLKKSDITVSRVAGAIWRRIEDIPQKFIWALPLPFTKQNRGRIEKFKDIHKGKRCFLIANGPSLKKIDFSLLKSEFTIGLNRIYLLENEKGFLPTYLGCVDIEAQLSQFLDDYDNLKLPVFFNWNFRHKFSKKENQCFVKDKLTPEFSYDIPKQGYGTGRSVTYMAMQLAYYMGFTEVYLIGKDHSYNTTEKTGATIESTGKEDNHFIKGYYKPGMKWFAPDLETEEYAYKLARIAFEKDGRIFKDATVDGKLTVFEKVDFYSLFPKN
jgi:hypothetical protein